MSNHQLGSRLREIRPSGPEGGGAGTNRSSLALSSLRLRARGYEPASTSPWLRIVHRHRAGLVGQTGPGEDGNDHATSTRDG